MGKRIEEETSMQPGKIVNLYLAGRRNMFSGILSIPRYADQIVNNFENGTEIVTFSKIDIVQKQLNIDICDYDAVVIGSFEIFDHEYKNGRTTVYITQVDLPTGQKVYPILSREGIKAGGVDPDLLIPKKY